MNKKEIKEIYDEIDMIQKIRISSIICILLLGVGIGGYIDGTFRTNDLYKQIDNISTNNHILTDGYNTYYISKEERNVYPIDIDNISILVNNTTLP